MGQSKHTPGPWMAKGYKITHTSGVHIADARLLANANLIAAAPELLAALEAIVANEHPKSDAYQIAFDAITKVKGGQQ